MTRDGARGRVFVAEGGAESPEEYKGTRSKSTKGAGPEARGGKCAKQRRGKQQSELGGLRTGSGTGGLEKR